MNIRLLLKAVCMGALLVSCKAKPAPDTDAPIALINAKPTISDQIISSGALSGLYKNAGDATPVILIVPGSGPTDLNGNSPAGLNTNTYKHLAEQLGARGLSTIRVDKRGMFSSASAGDPNAVTLDKYAEDYRGWMDTIRAKTKSDCVYLLGHSEGAVMLSAAAIGRDDVCGLILVAGPGRSFGDILRAQLRANPANFFLLKDALAAIDTLERGERVDVEGMNAALVPLFSPEVQGFLISVMKENPVDLARDAQQKTLIIQGTHDIQISTEDAEKLEAATGGTLVLIDGMNHILKDAPAGRIRNIATYSKPDLPVSPLVIDAIEAFVQP